MNLTTSNSEVTETRYVLQRKSCHPLRESDSWKDVSDYHALFSCVRNLNEWHPSKYNFYRIIKRTIIESPLSMEEYQSTNI
jgi:hypothetical protein